MSALPPKADIRCRDRHVPFGETRTSVGLSRGAALDVVLRSRSVGVFWRFGLGKGTALHLALTTRFFPGIDAAGNMTGGL